MNHLSDLLVDGSLLARLAEGQQVQTHLARRAIKRLRDASAGELRFLQRLFALGEVERTALIAAVTCELQGLADAGGGS